MIFVAEDTITEVIAVEIPEPLFNHQHEIFPYIDRFYAALVNFCIDDKGTSRLTRGITATTKKTEFNPKYVPSSCYEIEHVLNESVQITLPNPSVDFKKYELIRNAFMSELKRRYERLETLVQTKYTFSLDASEICDEIDKSELLSLTEVSEAVTEYIKKNDIKIHPSFARAYLDTYTGHGFDLDSLTPEFMTHKVIYFLIEVDEDIDLVLTDLLSVADFINLPVKQAA